LGKEDAARVGEQMGKAIIPRLVGKVIWFHSASVGESLSLLIVIDGMLRNYPNLYILVTTTTVTSSRSLAERLPDRATHQYCPYDTPYGIVKLRDISKAGNWAHDQTQATRYLFMPPVST
jgi:3-deoxy-D-manno-octulosonic-acid transferase